MISPKQAIAIGLSEQRRARGMAEGGTVGVLSTTARKGLPSSSFAVPGKRPGSGSYPVPDAAHARAALSRVSQFGSPSEKSAVRSKVSAKFPGIGAPKKMQLGGLVGAPPGGSMMAGDAPIVAALKRGLAQRAATRGIGGPPGGLMRRPAAASIMPGRQTMPGAPRMMAGGGSVPGRGTGDTVPATLTPGEFVVKKSAAKKNLGALKKINAGKKALPGDESESRADRIKEFETAHGETEI